MEGTVYWVNRGDPHVNNSGSVMKTHLDPKAAANPITLDEHIAELQGRPLAYRAKTCAHPEIGASCVGAGTRTSCRARALRRLDSFRVGAYRRKTGTRCRVRVR